jgi:hypothetical protein
MYGASIRCSVREIGDGNEKLAVREVANAQMAAVSSDKSCRTSANKEPETKFGVIEFSPRPAVCPGSVNPVFMTFVALDELNRLRVFKSGRDRLLLCIYQERSGKDRTTATTWPMTSASMRRRKCSGRTREPA